MKKRFLVTSSRRHHKLVRVSPIRGSISSPTATLARRCMLTPSSCLPCLPPASMTFSSAIVSTGENNTSSYPGFAPASFVSAEFTSKQNPAGAACFTWSGEFSSALSWEYTESWQPCKNTDINAESRGQKDVWPADTQATSFCWVTTLKQAEGKADMLLSYSQPVMFRSQLTSCVVNGDIVLLRLLCFLFWRDKALLCVFIQTAPWLGFRGFWGFVVSSPTPPEQISFFPQSKSNLGRRPSPGGAQIGSAETMLFILAVQCVPV